MRRASPPRLPIWCTFRQIAEEVIGCSERKLHQLRHEPWFPLAVELGPRALRWNRIEVVEAIAKHAPRASVRPEPEQLAGAREARADESQRGA